VKVLSRASLETINEGAFLTGTKSEASCYSATPIKTWRELDEVVNITP